MLEEAEEIEVWSPSYPRSLRTVWIGNNEQSVGQIRIHYSNKIAEILSSSPSSVDAGDWRPWGLCKYSGSRTWWTVLPTATASHEYQKQRSAEGGSAIDARSESSRSREKSKRQMEATISIKWYETQELNLFASVANKCEPSSSAYEWRTKGSTKPISAYKFNSEAT